MGILKITQKLCSSTLEISSFNALYDCQGHSNLACHFHSRQSFHMPNVGKPSAHPLNGTTTIGFPRLGDQEKYDIIVSMQCNF